MRKHAILAGILFASVMGQAGCGGKEADSPKTAPDGDTRPHVVVTNYPLYYFASRLAGEAALVELLVPAGEDPGYWKPEAGAVARMQRASLVLINGAGHEPWLDTVTLDERRLVDTSEGFGDLLIRAEDAVVHSHGPEGKHAHEGFVFTVWLDPELASKQLEVAAGALRKLLPEHEGHIEAAENELKAALEELAGLLDGFRAQYNRAPVLASHPVYQYLERRCGLNLKSVHWEPGVPPGDEEWRGLDDLLQEHPARWMLWEDEPTAETRAKLQERGIGVIPFHPCGNRPESGDFVGIMRENYEGLMQITSGGGN